MIKPSQILNIQTQFTKMNNRKLYIKRNIRKFDRLH